MREFISFKFKVFIGRDEFGKQQSYILKIMIPYFNGVALKGITDKTIEKYLDYLKNTYRTKANKRLPPKSIKHHYGTLIY